VAEESLQEKDTIELPKALPLSPLVPECEPLLAFIRIFSSTEMRMLQAKANIPPGNP
jgi:hypothetical protein